MMMVLSASSMAVFSDGRKDSWGEGQGKRKWEGKTEMHWAPRMHVVSIFAMYYSWPALKTRVPFSSTWVYLSRKFQKVHGPKCLFANGSQMTNSSQVTLSGSSPVCVSVCVCVCVCACVCTVSQLCLTLCDPMDYSVHGILQARILEWVAFPFFRGSSQARDQTQVSHIPGRFLTSWATREANHTCRLAVNYIK